MADAKHSFYAVAMQRLDAAAPFAVECKHPVSCSLGTSIALQQLLKTCLGTQQDLLKDQKVESAIKAKAVEQLKKSALSSKNSELILQVAIFLSEQGDGFTKDALELFDSVAKSKESNVAIVASYHCGRIAEKQKDERSAASHYLRCFNTRLKTDVSSDLYHGLESDMVGFLLKQGDDTVRQTLDLFKVAAVTDIKSDGASNAAIIVGGYWGGRMCERVREGYATDDAMAVNYYMSCLKAIETSRIYGSFERNMLKEIVARIVTLCAGLRYEDRRRLKDTRAIAELCLTAASEHLLQSHSVVEMDKQFAAYLYCEATWRCINAANDLMMTVSAIEHDFRPLIESGNVYAALALVRLLQDYFPEPYHWGSALGICEDIIRRQQQIQDVHVLIEAYTRAAAIYKSGYVPFGKDSASDIEVEIESYSQEVKPDLSKAHSYEEAAEKLTQSLQKGAADVKAADAVAVQAAERAQPEGSRHDSAQRRLSS